MGLEVVGTDETPVKAGDTIRSGVKVTFSPVGLTDLHVQAYALRLVCLNGATAMTVFEDYSLGPGQA